MYISIYLYNICIHIYDFPCVFDSMSSVNEDKKNDYVENHCRRTALSMIKFRVLCIRI